MALRLSDSPSDQMRASYEEASLDVWFGVITAYPEMRRWVAYNKTVPHVVLETLARDEDPAVRWAVALKRKAQPALLRLLAQDKDDTVRDRVALNRRTETDVLRLLAHDESWCVRESAERALASREPTERAT